MKEIRINGMKIFIWASVDLKDEKVIAVHVSCGRSYSEQWLFSKELRKHAWEKCPEYL